MNNGRLCRVVRAHRAYMGILSQTVRALGFFCFVNVSQKSPALHKGAGFEQ